MGPRTQQAPTGLTLQTGRSEYYLCDISLTSNECCHRVGLIERNAITRPIAARFFVRVDRRQPPLQWR